MKHKDDVKETHDAIIWVLLEFIDYLIQYLKLTQNKDKILSFQVPKHLLALVRAHQWYKYLHLLHSAIAMTKVFSCIISKLDAAFRKRKRKNFLNKNQDFNLSFITYWLLHYQLVLFMILVTQKKNSMY